jgi:MSHA biogenesis protein MshJ
MKALWAKYVARIERFSTRERLLVMAAAVLAAIAIVYVAAVDPAQRRQRALIAQITSQKEEIAALDKGAPAPTVDPDAANRARMDALKQQLRTADEALATMQRELVPADRMNAVLQEMLARDSQLTLVSLRTLPAEPLVPTPPDAAKGGDPPKAAAQEKAHVYKHGVEITIQGNYTSLHDYLARLERAPWRMYWWRARLNADDDARLTLGVTVYTLSLDRAWLKV